MMEKVTKRNTITVTYTDANSDVEYSFQKNDPVCPHCSNDIYNIGINEYTCTECGIIFECRGETMVNIGELIIAHDIQSADVVRLTKEIDKQDMLIKDLENSIESLKRVILMRYANRPKRRKHDGKK